MQQASRVSDWTAFLFNGSLIEYGETGKLFTKPVEKQTEEICLIAVQKAPNVIKYVKNPTDEINKTAIYNNPRCLEFIKEQTEELCILAVSKKGTVLEYVKEQTPAICSTAVRNDPEAIQFVEDQYEDICITAVRSNGMCLRFLKAQTPYVCTTAILNNPKAIQYVQNQTSELCITACIKDFESAFPYVKIKYIPDILQFLNLNEQRTLSEVFNK